jgi:hypothetical protein
VSWVLPLGVSAGHEDVVEAAGALAAVAASLVVASLWPPLSVRGNGAPGAGLCPEPGSAASPGQPASTRRRN